MFQITIAVFREFLEISILLSLFGAFASNIKNFRSLFFSGILLGAIGAGVIALFTEQISDTLDGMGHEIFMGCVVLFTSLLICSTLIWMKGYSQKLKTRIAEFNEGYDESLSSKIMIISLIATTIFREGSEIVLILYSISAIDGASSILYIQGFFLGAVLGISFGVGLYYGVFRFAAKYIFSVCSFIMTFIAAGLAAEAAKIFASVGLIEIFTDPLWNTSFIVSDDSTLGKILNVMMGYTAKPSGIELIFYLSTLSIIFISSQFFSGKSIK